MIKNKKIYICLIASKKELETPLKQQITKLPFGIVMSTKFEHLERQERQGKDIMYDDGMLLRTAINILYPEINIEQIKRMENEKEDFIRSKNKKGKK